MLAQHCVCACADFMCGMYCFCPELLLKGDDRPVFDIFCKFVRILEHCGAVSFLEASSAVEKFLTYVVDARSRHVSGNKSAEKICDIMSHLLSDYSFLARKTLCQVFKLCCLVAIKPCKSFPVEEIDLVDCEVPKLTVLSCVRGVQSWVLSSNSKQKAFFTKHTMERVRDTISGSHAFIASSSFNPWERISNDGRGVFVT